MSNFKNIQMISCLHKPSAGLLLLVIVSLSYVFIPTFLYEKDIEMLELLATGDHDVDTAKLEKSGEQEVDFCLDDLLSYLFSDINHMLFKHTSFYHSGDSYTNILTPPPERLSIHI